MSETQEARVESTGVEVDERYLLFTLGKELFGTPLLGVREVVEPQKPKEVPDTESYFRGVINIRGEIVGVIDLRDRLGYEQIDEPGQALMVFQTEAGALAALVDKVEAVVRLGAEQIDSDIKLGSSKNLDFVNGIARSDSGLITMMDLHEMMSHEQVTLK